MSPQEKRWREFRESMAIERPELHGSAMSRADDLPDPPELALRRANAWKSRRKYERAANRVQARPQGPLFKAAAIRSAKLERRPGEIQMKDFMASEMARLKCSRTWIMKRMKNGEYPGLVVRRVTKRTVFIRLAAAPPRPEAANTD